MIMKRLFFVICIFILSVSGCRSEIKDTPLKASDFLSAEEASSYIGYSPVAEEKDTRLCKSVKYKNSTVGEGDIVEVLVYPPNEKKSVDDIKSDYEYQKQKNTEYGSYIQVDGIDAEIFIAIPSVHIYKNGYYVVVTAGSGGEEEQINLLKSLAGIVVGHLDEMLPVDTEAE